MLDSVDLVAAIRNLEDRLLDAKMDGYPPAALRAAMRSIQCLVEYADALADDRVADGARATAWLEGNLKLIGR